MIAEAGGLGAARNLALGAHVEFVLEDEFEELLVGEVVTAGFLEAHFEGLEQSGEAQLPGLLFQGRFHFGCSFGLFC